MCLQSGVGVGELTQEGYSRRNSRNEDSNLTSEDSNLTSQKWRAVQVFKGMGSILGPSTPLLKGRKV